MDPVAGTAEGVSNGRAKYAVANGNILSINLPLIIDQPTLQLSNKSWMPNSWKRAHPDDSNNTPQPIGECQVDFPLLWIKDYPGLS